MDVSIDEKTVHWCGHTQHKINTPFAEFQRTVLKCNDIFYGRLFELQCSPDLMSVILETDIKYVRN